MAGLIPQTFIDDLLDRIDIVDVVDSRVKLKKTGKNYSACCPFHDEKTPSFTVSPEKQFYYCFGCGATGTALSFVLEHDRIPFPDAVEQLASSVGLTVPREQSEPNPQEQSRRKLYELLSDCDRFYRQQLRSHAAKDHATGYLKRRGLSGEIARDFAIGYAPPGWDNLLTTLGSNQESIDLLLQGGMLIDRPEDGKRYDRFRNRIMFPIRDSRGRVIGFGGRVLDDSKPKYLNSPETPVFHKGKELYGLFEARQAYRQLPRLLVVEGYMDVVALAQFGLRYAVATLGTACTEEHLSRAFKHTQEVVFCFDGDNAGRTAARRALENSLSAMQDGRQVRFLFLPDKEDPDTLVRKIGAEKFNHLIDNAIPLEEFLFDCAAEGIDVRSMEGRARFSKRAAPLIHKLPSGVFKELMFNHLAQRTGLSQASLMELVDLPPEPTPPTTPPAKPTQPSPIASDHPVYEESEPWTDSMPEPPPMEPFASEEPVLPIKKALFRHRGQFKLPPARLLLALLLLHPGLAADTPDLNELEEFGDDELLPFLRLVKLLRDRPNYKLPNILGYWRGKYGVEASQQLAELAATELLAEASNKHPFDPQTEYREGITRLQSHLLNHNKRQQLQMLQSKPLAQLSDEEKQLLRTLIQRQ